MPSVRDIFVRLGLKSDAKGIKKADDGIQGLVRGAKAAAVAFASLKVITSIRALSEETAALADRIDKVSSKLGVLPDTLQELRFAADQTGVAQNALDVGLQRFTRRASEAALGTGIAVDALKELGVSLFDSSGSLRPVDQLLGDVAEGLKNTAGDADRVRLAFKLFDTEGVNLVNTLKGGRSELEKLRRKARETGGILDKRLIQTSVEFTDVQGELKLTLQGVRNIIAKQMLPAFTKIAKRTILWVKQNRKLIQQRLGRFFKGVGDSIDRLSTFFSKITDLIFNFVRNATPLQKLLIALSVGFAAIAAVLALPAGSLILLGLLLLGIIDDFEEFRRGGRSVTGDLVKAFKGLQERFPKIAEALSKITDGISETFKTATNTVLTFGTFLKDTFTKGIEEAFDALKKNVGQLIEDLFGSKTRGKVEGLSEALAEPIKALRKPGTGAEGIVKSGVGFLAETLMENMLDLIEVATGEALPRGRFMAPGGGIAEPSRASSRPTTINSSVDITLNAPNLSSNMSSEAIAEEVGRVTQSVVEDVWDRRVSETSRTFETDAPRSGPL